MASKPSTRPSKSTADALAALPNLGPASARMLRQAGIANPAQLTRLGAIDAYLQVERTLGGVSLNLLWALAGALHECHWAKLPGDLRSSLLLELDARRAAEQSRDG